MFHQNMVFPSVAAAEAAVAALDDGNDFRFVIVVDPSGTGKAIIEVRDIVDDALIAHV